MSEQDTGQERTEEPTSKRLEDARKKGNVPRSRELTSAILMLGAAGALLMFGQSIGKMFQEIAQNAFTLNRGNIFDSHYLVIQLSNAISHMMTTLLPLFAIVIALVIFSSIGIGGWTFSGENLIPKFEKLDPIAGLKRVFSMKGLLELIKTLVKFFLIGGVAVLLIYLQFGKILQLMQEPLNVALSDSFWLMGWCLIALSAVLWLIAAIDVPFQLWQYHSQLKMTMQEIKDEYKEMEGKPEVKSKIRQLQEKIAQRKMMKEVPKADVVITNPTHYAVALKYDPKKRGAPRVVAKGVDFMAEQIRKIAYAHHVVSVSAPPLARSLFHFSKIDDEVPSGLYVAVAQILAYVYQLKRYRKQGGNPPVRPKKLPIPKDLQR